MEEIPSPPPVEVRPKSVTEQFIERIVAWAVLGGFVFGIFGVAFGVIAILFLEWEVPGIGILSPIFTSFLIGTILGAVLGSLIGLVSGVIRSVISGNPSGGGNRPSVDPPD